MAVALAGAGRAARLPAEFSGDPGAPGHPQAQQAARLPATLGEALKALEASDELRAAAGEHLFSAFAASRRAEIALADGQSDAQIVARSRWLL